VINLNNERFVAPGDMPRKIQEICRETGQWVPETEAEIVRTVIDSLLEKYVLVIAEDEALKNNKIARIHIVGGGSQDDLLNQITANATGFEVFAGPLEGTAMGNPSVQARTAGVLGTSLEDLRTLIARNFGVK
jgi:rhamnulokinase